MSSHRESKCLREKTEKKHLSEKRFRRKIPKKIDIMLLSRDMKQECLNKKLFCLQTHYGS